MFRGLTIFLGPGVSRSERNSRSEILESRRQFNRPECELAVVSTGTEDSRSARSRHRTHLFHASYGDRVESRLVNLAASASASCSVPLNANRIVSSPGWTRSMKRVHPRRPRRSSTVIYCHGP